MAYDMEASLIALQKKNAANEKRQETKRRKYREQQLVHKRRRTQALIDQWACNEHEFYRLHTILCLSFAQERGDAILIEMMFDTKMLAEHLDMLRCLTAAEREARKARISEGE